MVQVADRLRLEQLKPLIGGMVPYDEASGRSMHRTTIAGEERIAA